MAVTVTDLQAYLAGAAMPEVYAADQLSKVLAAETIAQRNVVGLTNQTTYAAVLDVALLRRCARSLAARVLPLGYDQSDSGTTSYVSGKDPEVRRLEAPYRRLAVG